MPCNAAIGNDFDTMGRKLYIDRTPLYLRCPTRAALQTPSRRARAPGVAPQITPRQRRFDSETNFARMRLLAFGNLLLNPLQHRRRERAVDRLRCLDRMAQPTLSLVTSCSHRHRRKSRRRHPSSSRRHRRSIRLRRAPPARKKIGPPRPPSARPPRPPPKPPKAENRKTAIAATRPATATTK